MKKIILYITIITILTSCASFFNNNEQIINNNYNMPEQINKSFDISGRFYTQRNNKKFHGNFSWIKNNELQQFNILTPLGTTVATILINNNDQYLIYKNKKYDKDKLNSIMNEQLGFSLPLNSINYWIQGVNYPTQQSIKLVSNGFIQDGWLIQYINFENSHPKIIYCTKNNLTIKFYIKW